MTSNCQKETKKPFTNPNRKAPAYNANRCCGMIMPGKDGSTMYESRADKNGRCTWFLLKEEKEEQEQEQEDVVVNQEEQRRGRSKSGANSVRFEVASKRPRSLSPDGLPRAGWLRTQIKEQHVRPLKEAIVLRQPLKAPRVARARSPSAVARLATKAALWDVLRAEVQLEDDFDSEKESEIAVQQTVRETHQIITPRRKRSRSLSPDGLPKRDYLVEQIRESDIPALKKVIVAQQPEKSYRVSKANTLPSVVALATKPQLVAALRLRKHSQPFVQVEAVEIVETIQDPTDNSAVQETVVNKVRIIPADDNVASKSSTIAAPAAIVKTTTTTTTTTTKKPEKQEDKQSVQKTQNVQPKQNEKATIPVQQSAETDQTQDRSNILVVSRPNDKQETEQRQRQQVAEATEAKKETDVAESAEKDETEVCTNSENEVIDHLIKFDDGAFVVRESTQQPNNYRVYVSWPQPGLSENRQFSVFTLEKTGKTGDRNKWTLRQRFDVKTDSHADVTVLKEFPSIIDALQHEFPDSPALGFVNVCSVAAPVEIIPEPTTETSDDKTEKEEPKREFKATRIERIRENPFFDKRAKSLLRGIFNDAMAGHEQSETFLKALRDSQPALFDYLRSEQIEYVGKENPVRKVSIFNDILRNFDFPTIATKNEVEFPLSPPPTSKTVVRAAATAQRRR